MKKSIAMLMTAFVMAASFPVMAEEAAQAPQVDPTATNISTPYPVVDTAIPPAPVPPEGGVQDFANFKKYADEVDAYIKAIQKYIDGATNDANDIINKRNEAVQKAQAAVDQYNSFFDKEEKK